LFERLLSTTRNFTAVFRFVVRREQLQVVQLLLGESMAHLPAHQRYLQVDRLNQLLLPVGSLISNFNDIKHLPSAETVSPAAFLAAERMKTIDPIGPGTDPRTNKVLLAASTE
jgi:hypothetical protein